MGDIADEHYDRMMDQMAGNYGGWFGRGAWLPRRDRNRTTCKNCGSADVHWREVDGGWRLYENERQHPGNRYVVHDCTPEPTADGFDDEPIL